jgi:hypothetical protein
MNIKPFKMERLQSVWENVVEYNLSESGVHPMPPNELIPEAELESILRSGLGYSQSNGTPELRAEICKLYPGAVPDEVLVTSGSAEANFLLMWSRIEPGDEVVFMMPNYMQIWGLLGGFGARIKPLFLKEKLNWAPDLDDLKKMVTPKTKMIIVTNPNNPTGAILSREEMKTIVALSEKSGAWILADEVYRGAEHDGRMTPSFWGMTERVIVTAGLSKAYGLPGLRIGWIIGPKDLILKTWPYHDYTTICPSLLSDKLARIALGDAMRGKILARTRKILLRNFPVLESWLRKHAGLFHYIPPLAGAICYPRYSLNINSTELVVKLIQEKSVLIVPGDHFEMDHYLRIGFGSDEAYLRDGLSRVDEFLASLK